MSTGATEPAFTAPMESHSFAGVLMDLDGTIVDSTEAIVKHWHKLGKELGVDPNVILASSHGRRSIDTLQSYDPTKANWDCSFNLVESVLREYLQLNLGLDVSHVEGLIPQQYGSDAIEIPGARALLHSLEAAGARWAIVTSGTTPLATGWLDVMKLARPQHLVVAEDVQTGKPDPECYLLGKDRLGLSARMRVLVIEDAPAGIRAGKNAGCEVVGVATTHSVAQLMTAGADWIVRDLRSLKVVGISQEDGAAVMEICNALKV